MTISPARLAANQQNAQRSTGPKTAEGKSKSRLNAFRHGMAGPGDLAMPAEDRALIKYRQAAFIRELAAPGEVGALLAHRAAVLSVRVERLAVAEMVEVEINIQAARGAFDDERARLVRELVESLNEAIDPHTTLDDLEAMPEGVAALEDVWRGLHGQVAAGEAGAEDRATCWLNARGEPAAADLVGRIDAELARLRQVAESPAIHADAEQVAARRDEAGLLAGFDPAPEATLARRYEAAAERGIYRALRAISDLRQEQGQRQSQGSIPDPLATATRDLAAAQAAFRSFTNPSPTAQAQTSAQSQPIQPAAAASLGSFRAARFDLIQPAPDSIIDLLGPPSLVPIPPRKRLDPRKLERNRR